MKTLDLRSPSSPIGRRSCRQGGVSSQTSRASQRVVIIVSRDDVAARVAKRLRFWLLYDFTAAANWMEKRK